MSHKTMSNSRRILDVWAMTLVVQWSKAPPGELLKYYFAQALSGGMGLWTRDIACAQPFELEHLEPVCRDQAASRSLRSVLSAKGYKLVAVVPNRIIIPPADMLLPAAQPGAAP